jgi:hypothetical protein
MYPCIITGLQDRNITEVNKSLGNVAKFKYCKLKIINQNYIYEEIIKSLNCRILWFLFDYSINMDKIYIWNEVVVWIR